MNQLRSRSRALWIVLVLGAVPVWSAACAGASPQSVAPATSASASASSPASASAWVEPPDGPMPVLRTGELTPIDEGRAEVRTHAHWVDGAWETIRIDLGPLQRWGMDGWGVQFVATPVGSAGSVYAFASRARFGTDLWVRRPKSEAGKPLSVDLYSTASGGQPGHHVLLAVTGIDQSLNEPKLAAQWRAELAGALPGTGAWRAFAQQRLASPAGKQEPPRLRPGIREAGPSDLARLMETTTGAAALQEAVQADRPLFLGAARKKADIPMARLHGPELRRHPWAEMIAKLSPAPQEPMAAAAPAEFWYVRVSGITPLLSLIDHMEAWITPMAVALDSRSEDRKLAKRYEAELGLARGPLTAALGPSVVSEIALVGSDPYVREGTDVTVVFRVKSRGAFDAAMSAALGSYASAHGGMSTSVQQQGGIELRLAKSADGAVRQYRATSGDLEVVSNSAGAARRVIDTIAGKHAKLSEEPDFRYMLARDATVRNDVLAFASDKFVAEVIGPRQKIQEARRQIALSELSVPGYAALLHGWMTGRAPESTEELLKAGLLRKEELKHTTGQPIAWKPGDAATSAWGRPERLESLIDLPSPDKVTDDEKTAYEFFARSYENDWKSFIDPVALRMVIEAASVSAELRALPLIQDSEYREFIQLVGDARVQAPALQSGARVVVGIGQGADVRREMSTLVGRSTGHDMKLDWLGDWGMIGVIDRPALASAFAHIAGDISQRPPNEAEQKALRERDDFEVAGAVPVYAALGVKSTTGAALTIAALRKIAEDSLPGMVTWGESSKHRDVPIVRIAVQEKRGRMGGGFALYYTLQPEVLYVALQEGALRALIDAHLEGRGPGKAPATAAEASQFMIDVGADKGSALFQVISWLLESEASRSTRSRGTAEALLRGAPHVAGNPDAFAALARNYFGVVPTTPDGLLYVVDRDGVRDPNRGTEHAPRWPSVPVAGSPAAKALGSVRSVRTSVQFDEEPTGGRVPERSLHVKMKLGTRN